MCETVDQVYTADQTSRNVAVRERRHLIHNISIVSAAFIFNLLDQVRVRLLTSCMNIEWTAVLAGPLAPLKSLEAQN